MDKKHSLTPVLAIALLLGCSDSADDISGPAFASGTRLRAKLSDGGSGAVVLEGFLDTKLNELCDFYRTKDGKTRCVPAFWDTTLVYTDPECKNRAATRDACAEGEGKYVTTVDESFDCPGTDVPLTVYELSASMGMGKTYSRFPDGSCLEMSSEDVPLFAVTEASLNVFVAATVTQQSLGDGFTVDVFEGEDGSRVFNRLNHEGGVGTCRPALLGADASGEQNPCIPPDSPNVRNRGPYADASCTQPLLELPASCSKPSISVMQEKPGEACGPTTRTLRAVGDAVNPGMTYTYYTYKAPMCDLSSGEPSPGVTTYALGEPVSTSQYPSLKRVHGGSGRLRALSWATPSGAQATPAWGYPRSSVFYDETLKDICAREKFADGRVRCVPTPLRIAYSDDISYFEDAACTKPIFVEYLPAGDCSLSGDIFYGQAEPRKCSTELTLTGISKVSAPVGEKQIYVDFGDGTCNPKLDNVDYYVLEPVDLAQFHEITERVE